MGKYSGISIGTGALFIFIIIYIWAPIAVLMLFSFKSDASITFPFPGFSFRWYKTFLNDPSLIRGLFQSLQMALMTMVVTTLICISTALGLRKKFPGRDVVFYMIMLGIIVPGVVYGVGAAIFFGTWLKVTLSIWTVLPIQIVWTLPFGLILMLARFDPALLLYEQAAATLGASRFKILREVTFPLIYPQIMATALFAFTLSFGELMRSVYISSSAHPLLSVLVYSVVANQPATPKFYALGTVVSLIAIVLLMVAALVMVKGPGKKVF